MNSTGIAEFLSYGFIQRLDRRVLYCTDLLTAWVILVLRRLSLIGDGLSHVTFAALRWDCF